MIKELYYWLLCKFLGLGVPRLQHPARLRARCRWLCGWKPERYITVAAGYMYIVLVYSDGLEIYLRDEIPGITADEEPTASTTEDEAIP